MPRQDSSYRHLFSYPRMVRDLVQGFLSDGSSEADPELLERQSGSYVNDRHQRREQDLVWRVQGWNGVEEAYLLLELQSRVDPHMDVRMTTYRGLFCEELIRSGGPSRRKKSPLVIPVVFYNGRRPWTAAGVEPAGWQLDKPLGWASYLLVDVLHGPLPESAGEDNLVAVLCELERSQTPEAIDQQVARLAKLLEDPELAGLRRAFTAFIQDSLLPGRFPGAVIPAIQDLEEIRPMLRETVKGWTRQWLEEGRQEGRREGEVDFLIRLAERKFGPLEGGVRTRIEAAEPDQLFSWGERLLGAGSLEEVFSS